MDPQSWTDEQIHALADARNRSILTILDEAGRSLGVAELAEQLTARDVALVDAVEYDSRVERARISLHHDRLPRLDDAGLIDYDRATNVATPRTSPSFDDEWQDRTVLDALEAHLPSGPGTDGEDGGVLTGRESVIHYGRQLADEAEEELFCMYVGTDLLEEECIQHARNAIERGVTMYMGARDAEVRELTRERLPEATLWEPQLDWLNTSNYPRVGRLVLIDRRKVMLAVLEEPTHGGGPAEETAVVGDGEDHPLVVLTRELLGSRLDHLDYQSEDFRREQLP